MIFQIRNFERAVLEIFLTLCKGIAAGTIRGVRELYDIAPPASNYVC